MKNLTIYMYRSPECFVEVYRRMTPDYQKAYNSFRVLKTEKKNEVITLMHKSTLLNEVLRYPDMLCIAKAISSLKKKEKIPSSLKQFIMLCAIDAVANRVFLDKVYSLIREDQEKRTLRIEDWQREKEVRLAKATSQFASDIMKNN